MLAEALVEFEELKHNQPSLFYKPHAGQQAFHAAKHQIRLLAPGNRWGKTTAAAIEADRTLQHTRRDNLINEVLWFVPQLRQFDILQAQLDAMALTKPYTLNAQDNLLIWHNTVGHVKGKMWIIPSDQDWKRIQGVNPDLIVMDEEPPLALWNELQARSFGAKRTRYIFTMTSTEGWSWVADKIWLPWKNYHEGMGIGEEDAMHAQRHPLIWAWPIGGIEDNTSISEDEQKRFLSLDFGHQNLNKIRRRGGFLPIGQHSVFSLDALEWMRAANEKRTKGRTGGILAV